MVFSIFLFFLVYASMYGWKANSISFLDSIASPFFLSRGLAVQSCTPNTASPLRGHCVDADTTSRVAPRKEGDSPASNLDGSGRSCRVQGLWW